MRCPVLVGRERELVVLADALARAESGDGAAVFVVGAAGIGKSALARSAVALARERGVLALVGRAVPRPSPTPYRALTEALLTSVGGRRFRPVPRWRRSGLPWVVSCRSGGWPVTSTPRSRPWYWVLVCCGCCG